MAEYDASDWRLFSIVILKCVLLHNGNILASITIVYPTNLEEKGVVVKVGLEKVKCNGHQCVKCVALRMVFFLQGQQGGYTICLSSFNCM